MYALLAALARLLPPAAAREEDFAQQLMEGADARAGLSPHQALELRQAAQAWLSVVR